nr:hypothetical protein Itr_chr12CG22440 [Ipomoea trifida]
MSYKLKLVLYFILIYLLLPEALWICHLLGSWCCLYTFGEFLILIFLVSAALHLSSLLLFTSPLPSFFVLLNFTASQEWTTRCQRPNSRPWSLPSSRSQLASLLIPHASSFRSNSLFLSLHTCFMRMLWIIELPFLFIELIFAHNFFFFLIFKRGNPRLCVWLCIIAL